MFNEYILFNEIFCCAKKSAPEGKKVVPKNISDLLTSVLALAVIIWMMDETV